MRHADDLFNASESIITAVDGDSAGSQAIASTGAVGAAGVAITNGAATKSVHLKSSALTPGRGRAVAGGAWAKVEVKTR